MNFFHKLLAAIFLLLALVATIKAQPSVTMDIDPNAPDMKFEKDTIQYGIIANNADGWRALKVINTGKSPLIIQDVKGDCGCTSAEVKENGNTTKMWTQEPIAPGKTGFIKVHYDTKRTGPFTKNVRVTSNAKTNVMVFVIKGEVKAPGEVVPVENPKTKKPGRKSSLKPKKQPAPTLNSK